MANKKITELDAITTLASTDVVPVVDVSADTTHKITTTNLFRTLPDGTAASPSLSFASDAGNGVFLAGTDTVGISTGGTQRVTVDGSGNVTISGDLQVDGATTTVQSTTVTIDDKNLELGSVASPSDTTADGGGITLKGATDKTLKWIDSTGCWTFNQPMNFNDHVRIDSSGNVGIGTTSVGRATKQKVCWIMRSSFCRRNVMILFCCSSHRTSRTTPRSSSRRSVSTQRCLKIFSCLTTYLQKSRQCRKKCTDIIWR